MTNSNRRNSLARRATLLVAALTVTFCTNAAFASTASAAAAWVLHNVDGDRWWDVATWDGNSSGCAEQSWADLDNDGNWDTHAWTTNGDDCSFDVVTFDLNENGRPEAWVVGTTYSLDRNEDGWRDVWGAASYSAAYFFPSSVVSTPTSLDPVNRLCIALNAC